MRATILLVARAAASEEFVTDWVPACAGMSGGSSKRARHSAAATNVGCVSVSSDRSSGRSEPAPAQTLMILLLTQDAVEFDSGGGDLVLHDRQEGLAVRQDDAVLQELG